MSKRPRKKKNKECPNPLYLKWLEEWRDEARDKGSKMQHTYAKVPLESVGLFKRTHSSES